MGMLGLLVNALFTAVVVALSACVQVRWAERRIAKVVEDIRTDYPPQAVGEAFVSHEMLEMQADLREVLVRTEHIERHLGISQAE